MKLITGGSGFLGTQLAKKLIESGKRVRILDLNEPEKSILRKAEFVQADITRPDAIKKAFEGVDTVFNTFAITPMSNVKSEMYQKVNVLGTKNVLEASKASGIKKFIHISTTSVYGVPKRIPCAENSPKRPLDDYGRTKLAAEKVCLSYSSDFKLSIIRPATILGEGRLGIFQLLFKWITNNKNVYLIGSGKNYYQLVHIDDLISACLLAEKKSASGIFNVGNETNIILKDELQNLINYAGKDSKIIGISPAFARSVLRTLHFMHVSPVAKWQYEICDKDFVCDARKARKELGWKPKWSNAEALKQTYDWYNRKKGSFRTGTTHKEAPKSGILKILDYI